MNLDLATVKTVYRQAVDAHARDAEGDAWWAEVAAEVQAVLDEPDGSAAARVISWWHDDWSRIGDTAARGSTDTQRGRACSASALNREES